jgi:hypothetical protein
MTFRCFGTPDPPSDANPTLARLNTLKFWKKALSSFMPNRLMEWSRTREEGNPTRSIEINDLIKRVKKKEVRKQGAVSKTRRPMKEAEFRLLIQVLKDNDKSYLWKFGIPALVNFQFHMIARIDDTTQFVLENLRMHDNFPNVLKARLTWSKNVQDERDAPWQIVLGSLDSVFCVYLSLSLWLELNLKTNPNSFESPYVFSFSNDVDIPSGGVKTKDVVQNVFGQKVFNREEFLDDEGPLGSHSIRKFGATHVRRCGCSKDEKDIRGRWKGKGRVSDVYDDVELPYPDAKVAEKLCFGGACIYKNCDEDDAFKNSVINSFLLTIVVPNIRKKLPELVSLVLGRSFLWCVYSEFHYMVPEDVKNEIKKGLGEVRTWETNSEKNPIIQQQVLVTGNQGSVFLDEILDSGDQANDLEENGVGNNREI